MSLKGIAQQTLDILEVGWYEVDGRKVEIAEAQREAVAGTRLYRPADLEDLIVDGGTANDGRPAIAVTHLRPHVEPFLAWCSTRFDLAVWTASSEDYAKPVVAQLFGSLDRIVFLWARQRCTRRHDLETREQYWVKDLKKVRKRGYRLEHVIVVDDTARKHERNYGNLIHVRRWEGDEEDDELLALRDYLETLAEVENVRAIEKRGWRSRAGSKDGRE